MNYDKKHVSNCNLAVYHKVYVDWRGDIVIEPLKYHR